LSADHVKKAALELGGNAPFIVLEDANLELAVECLIANKFRCGGQTCVCANRVYVHNQVRDTFRTKLIERMSRLVVGEGIKPETDLGPLIDRPAFEKVTSLVKDALARGARKTYGETPQTPPGEWGAFYPPTLLEDVTEEMEICRDEVFGPVISMMSFTSDEEVIRRANETIYGLAGYVFTENQERGLRMIERLQIGHVGLNSGSGPIPEAPFGGMKQSGFGREGGLEGLYEYIECQTVVAKS
jgi:succinate-semialdehyde dehydrogenase/glutarate-semialdehyde dehydrogenase